MVAALSLLNKEALNYVTALEKLKDFLESHKADEKGLYIKQKLERINAENQLQIMSLVAEIDELDV